jgi:hypothetical protein
MKQNYKNLLITQSGISFNLPRKLWSPENPIGYFFLRIGILFIKKELFYWKRLKGIVEKFLAILFIIVGLVIMWCELTPVFIIITEQIKQFTGPFPFKGQYLSPLYGFTYLFKINQFLLQVFYF